MSVSTSYAKALYEAAKEKQIAPELLGKVEVQMDELQRFFCESKELRTALLSPLTSSREKTAILNAIGQKLNLVPLLSQFLELLVRKGRLGLLKEIQDSFSSVRLTAEGGIAGRMVAADLTTEADIESLSKAFSQKFGKKVAFRVTTDPSLLAGIKVTVNGVTYDGTLRSQIQKLRDQFVAGMPGAQA